MTLFFGLEYDDLVFTTHRDDLGGHLFLGSNTLLSTLESFIGLNTPTGNIEHLRIESYRQLLDLFVKKHPDTFFQASFIADQLATAESLLKRRDELKLAGWDFGASQSAGPSQTGSESPERLHIIAQLENDWIAQKKRTSNTFTLQGFADRFCTLLEYLPHRKIPISKIVINEPKVYWPTHLQRLFTILSDLNIVIEQKAEKQFESISDLGYFQQLLNGQIKDRKNKQALKGDGSLLLVYADRETQAAAFLARLFRDNQQFRPLCLVPEKNRALDNALIQQGLPSLGILSASLARPSLQILKLITTFFWNPIDPFKILEFVSLQIKPLDDELAILISQQMAQTPGLKGEGWNAMLARFFGALVDNPKAQKDKDIDLIRFQYQFWFERKRYDVSQQVPKEDVIEVFDYLANWALQVFEEKGSRLHSLLVLSEQAKRVKDLLEALSDEKKALSFLDLEQIVRAIYEPSPALFRATQIGHLKYVHHNSAFVDQTPGLVWWNFIQNERDHFFARWYQSEYEYLEQLGCRLQKPEDENQLLLWQRKQPILNCKDRLILIIPKRVDGSEVFYHPLQDEMEAFFESLNPISCHIDNFTYCDAWQNHFNLPDKVKLDHHSLQRPQAFIEVESPEQLGANEHETFTSLDTLLYYPYQWVFRYKIKLRNSNILSVVKDRRLMGNLAHRLLEYLFQEDITSWTKGDIEKWMDQNVNPLLAKEGAVLLMYGREPERIAFINKMKYAAWSLVSSIQKNGWTVEATEMNLDGHFDDVPLRGKADLVLKRGEEKAVIDLKWSGATWRENSIRNEEDLQLVLYARLLSPDKNTAHTSFFIIDKGKMIARDSAAFKEVIPVSPDSISEDVNGRIYDKMIATYRWRMAQLKEGQIEVRTRQTVSELEEEYGAELMDLLEMRNESSPFDDYQTLISLIG